jgi:predicted RNase H-like HicB family nuclease
MTATKSKSLPVTNPSVKSTFEGAPSMKQLEVERYMALPYPFFVSQQGSGYTVELLEFPGCAARGKTVEDAKAALDVAKREWIINRLRQGLDVPVPRNLADLKRQFDDVITACKEEVVLGAIRCGITSVDRGDGTFADLVESIVAAAQKMSKRSKKKQSRKRAAASVDHID